MEMINRAFEDADAFSKMMEKITLDGTNLEKPNRGLISTEHINLSRRVAVMPQQGNRAQRRAAAKKAKRNKAIA
jgi:hypothetical protein